VTVRGAGDVFVCVMDAIVLLGFVGVLARLYAFYALG